MLTRIERFVFAERLPGTFTYWSEDWRAQQAQGWDVQLVLERVKEKGIWKERSVIALAVKP